MILSFFLLAWFCVFCGGFWGKKNIKNPTQQKRDGVFFGFFVSVFCFSSFVVVLRGSVWECVCCESSKVWIKNNISVEGLLWLCWNQDELFEMWLECSITVVLSVIICWICWSIDQIVWMFIFVLFLVVTIDVANAGLSCRTIDVRPITSEQNTHFDKNKKEERKKERNQRKKTSEDLLKQKQKKTQIGWKTDDKLFLQFGSLKNVSNSQRSQKQLPQLRPIPQVWSKTHHISQRLCSMQREMLSKPQIVVKEESGFCCFVFCFCFGKKKKSSVRVLKTELNKLVLLTWFVETVTRGLREGEVVVREFRVGDSICSLNRFFSFLFFGRFFCFWETTNLLLKCTINEKADTQEHDHWPHILRWTEQNSWLFCFLFIFANKVIPFKI